MLCASLNKTFPSFLIFPGTTTPVTCPNLQFIDKEGASDVSECQPCPAGRICPANSTVSEPCLAGHYCPVSQSMQVNNILGYFYFLEPWWFEYFINFKAVKWAYSYMYLFYYVLFLQRLVYYLTILLISKGLKT